jgi:3-oxoacyl-[acyl-carrier-protein] synthase-3
MGKFLPGPPVGNDEIEDHIGRVGGKPSRLRARILRQNGIRSRHYATRRDGEAPLWNHDLAARATLDALARGSVAAGEVEFLAAATSQGDLLAPGFASMVHGALGLPPCEIASLHGVCSSGVMALQAAYRAVAAGDKANAVAVASELASRFFQPHLFEATREFRQTGRVSFEAEFLRFMLSDGAGAAVLESRPSERGLSLRVDWIDLLSYADRLDACMYAGARKDESGALVRSWHDYGSVCEAVRDGAVLLTQDVGLLDNIVTLGVGRYFELVQEGRIRPAEVDWFACHYSSHVFRGRILDLIRKGGACIPEERWFTNLYTRGNTGSASIYIMLEELLNGGHLRPGQKVLCMVPESGRFVVAFMMLTVVGEEHSRAAVAETEPEPESPLPPDPGHGLRASLTRQLASVWVDFETGLRRVPIVDKIHRRALRLGDYRLLLLNLRQQVVEGARWIARAASSLTRDELGLRSEFIRHAAEEHRDYQMLENDFVSVGGRLADIQNGEKNVGSEALSAWMLHRASQENPLDLLGAMFIIEGLGTRVAGPWARAIQEQLSLGDEQVSFLRYHGANDERHFERLHDAMDEGRLTPELVARIVKTARVTARLYRLQLEELGNC